MIKALQIKIKITQNKMFFLSGPDTFLWFKLQMNLNLLKPCNLTLTVTCFKSNWKQRVQEEALCCQKASQEVN